MSQSFSLGVNYWPRKKAMYWWSNFEAEEVQQDFKLLSELGMNVVRIFLLWDDWQKSPDTVSEDCLQNLGTVCDIAAEHNLGLDVTFFTGHMSGPNWSPQWLLSDSDERVSPYILQVVSGGEIVDKLYRNMFTDEIAVQAARLLLKTVVERYKDHRAIWMWNLGNEPDLFAHPPDSTTGRAWVEEMKALIDSIDGEHPVTCGLHVASLHEDNGLRVNDVFGVSDVAVMHAYPMYLPWARDNLDPDLVPYTCALVTALSGKPTLMEEWGGCTALPGEASYIREWNSYGKDRKQFMASEEDLADYVAKVLPKLVEVGATGAMLWCFADYAEELWDKPPCDQAWHERYFGLVRPDGSVKLHAEVIRQFAQSKPTVQAAQRTVELNVTPEVFYQAAALYTMQFYREYLEKYETT